MSDCQQCDKPRSVGLVDGAQVCSYCERWRSECEARELLQMQIDARRDRLTKIEERRGKKATDRLRDAMMVLWQKNRPTLGAGLKPRKET